MLHDWLAPDGREVQPHPFKLPNLEGRFPEVIDTVSQRNG